MTCDCSATEFTGDFCQTEKTPCDSNPCENNGVCNVVEDADVDNGLVIHAIALSSSPALYVKRRFHA